MTSSDDVFDPIVASEQEVAETIVSARKSWKTVKGKSEPVWPPDLEKALVKALLQYKPNDSRYARALGRFPKRNRFISDFIYEQTGVRRTPKQVGSRLQQLKDVNCGKQLLNHVANWSLGTPAIAAPGGHGSDVGNIELKFESSDGSPSPTTRFPHGASSLGLDCGSLASPTLSSLYSPGSSYGSLPVTPQARRLDVFLHYDPYDPRNTDHPSGARQPLRRFSGCLTHPDTIFPLDKHVQQFPLAGAEPSVVFLAREPIAAQSVTTVRYDGDRPNSADGRGSPPGGSNTSARSMSAPPTQVLRESYPLVCMQMPAVASPQSRSPYSSDDDADAYANMMNGRHHQEYFVYSTQLFNDGFWNGLRRENCLGRYTITQDLICNLDFSAARRGETFLSINYHFVPLQPHAATPAAFVSSRGSASPPSSSSSSSSSHSGASPVSTVHAHMQPYNQQHLRGHVGSHVPLNMHYNTYGHIQHSPPSMTGIPPMTSSSASRMHLHGQHHVAHGGFSLNVSAGSGLSSNVLPSSYSSSRAHISGSPSNLGYNVHQGLNNDVESFPLTSPVEGQLGINPSFL